MSVRKSEARLVGEGPDGRPRMRVPADYFDNGPFSHLADQRRPADALYAPALSGQEEVRRSRDAGVRQGQQAERDSEQIRGGIDRKAITVMGANIFPDPNPDTTWLGLEGTAAIDFRIQYGQAAASVFNEWGSDILCRCDAQQHYQFGGLMWAAYRQLASADAETCGYIGYDRERADRKGHKWATFVEVVDPRRLSTPSRYQDWQGPSATPRREGDPRIINGREVDELGAMEALWFSVADPSDGGTVRHQRIPRQTEFGRPMAFHWFFKRRPGMQRALPNLLSVLRTIRYLNKFSDAYLQNAITHSMLATFVKSTMAPEKVAEHMTPQDDLDGSSVFNMKVDAYERMNLTLGGKRIPVLGPNDEIVFEGLEGTLADFDPMRNAFLRELASSLNMPFEQLSLDFSRANYSSTRSSIIEGWRSVTFDREMFTRHIASLIFDAVIEEAFALDILREPNGAPSFEEARAAYTRCDWIGPGMGWVDPLKEVDAAKGRIESAISTLPREASSQGGNWYANVTQKAMVERTAEALGTSVTTGAAVVAAEEPPADEDEQEETENA